MCLSSVLSLLSSKCLQEHVIASEILLNCANLNNIIIYHCCTVVSNLTTTKKH